MGNAVLQRAASQACIIRTVTEYGYNALMGEVLTTPKPGLVDQKDNGAHTDMNLLIFKKSADAIAPYLGWMFCQGMTIEGTPAEVFLSVRKTGMKAEHAMFRATGGVNTHKGAVFTLGILSAAAGRCMRIGVHSPEQILKMSATMTNRILTEELCGIRERESATFGEQLYQSGDGYGIRGEAMFGFPSIANAGLPAMREAKEAGAGQMDGKLHVLLRFMACLEDTCVLKRGGWAGARWLKEEAGRILSETAIGSEERLNELEWMNRECIRKNISPGGAADLLSAVLLLEQLCGMGGSDFM